MNYLFPSSAHEIDRIQSRLMIWAAIFLAVYSLILTLSPSVRIRTLEGPYRGLHWIGYLVWLFGFMAAHRIVLKKLEDRDPYILPVTALLSGLGLLSIWRLDQYFAIRQTIWLIICLTTILIALRVDNLLTLLKKYKYIWLVLALLLTFLTIFLGVYPGGIGPELWLGCCGIYLQPSEPLKLLFIIYLASYLSGRLPFNFKLMPTLLPTIILVGIALSILLVQRDLGTASLFILIYFTMLYLASGKRRILIVGGVLILFAGILGYYAFDLIQIRVQAWLNPWIDPSGRSYQIVQSLMAIANGGIIGRGPGLGSPGLVPIAHSDFIFSSIAEELGLFGTIAVFILYAILVGRGLSIALYAKNPYQRYLAAGIVTSILIQSILIIGGNLRVLPLTGLTLPFVSYGGSSLLVTFFSILILLMISNQSEREPSTILESTSYLYTGAFLLVTLMVLALANGWWSIVRSESILDRLDNPRRSIADRYVKRGPILDRRSQPLVVTVGDPGNFTRNVLHPPLGPIVGYSNPIYGQFGIEETMDGYLRGLQGTPSSLVWSNHLLYGQHPPGLDVRLTIDLDLQQFSDELLSESTGAAIVMNAENGEILAMSTHPFFDPNQINEKWEEWVNDPASPLLNRTTQGQYPMGSALGPFLLTKTIETAYLPTPPQNLAIRYHGDAWNCAAEVNDDREWGELIANGCPGAIQLLSSQLEDYQVENLYKDLEFRTPPQVRLPSATGTFSETLDNPLLVGMEIPLLRIPPLQLAKAAAALSNQGLIPDPRIVLAVNTPRQGWVTLGVSAGKQVFPEVAVEESTALLKAQGMPYWHSFGKALSDQDQVSWYMSGSRSDWQGIPFVVVIALEDEDPQRAFTIGESLTNQMLSPQ